VSILSDQELIDELASRQIVSGITPSHSPEQQFSRESPVQPASIDFHIGSILIPEPAGRWSLRALLRQQAGAPARDDHVLKQGETAVIVTREEFKLPDDIAAITFPPSRIAFRGLLVTNPGHIDPGYAGPMRFMAINMAKEAFTLRKGDEIATVLFFRMNRSATLGWSARNPGGSPQVTQASVNRLSADFLNVEARARDAARDVSEKQRWLMFVTAVTPVLATLLVTLIGFAMTLAMADWWPPASTRELLDVRRSTESTADAASRRSDEALAVARNAQDLVKQLQERLDLIQAPK
jgi:dCTP deaminase